MAIRNLFIKECRSILPIFGVFALAVLLLHLFILSKSDVWDNDAIFAVSLMLPYLFSAAIALGAGYYQLQVEWRTNSIYLLLSLPIRGWKVLATKLAAVLSLFIATTLWISASFAAILLRTQIADMKADEDFASSATSLLNVVFHSFWMYVLTVLFLLAIIQFAFLCGQLVSRFKWLVVLSAFFAAMYLVLRVTPLLAYSLQWTPEIFFGGNELEAVYLYSGPFLILLLTSIGFIGLSGFIYDREVEV